METMTTTTARTTHTGTPATERNVVSPAARYVFGAVRLALGFYFLWAFLDKLFGLGKSTPSERAWLNGGSPTTGYLSNSSGPFADFFASMAGSAWADWLFMLGLLGIGAALMLGIGMRVAAVSGTLLYVMMWASALPMTTNPFLDDHLLNAMVLVGLALIGAGRWIGLGGMWEKLPIVQRMPWLK
ncbi:hypothetical protein [Melissospora conviva]|uniref:hypothetical protein n=1 Tax=Melissospora conviva TaxID=3388432 RepID=UPI003B7A58C1